MNNMKRFGCALLLAGVLAAQALVGSIADITGNAAAHPLSTTVQGARWIKVSCLTGNSAAVRLGDSNTSVSRGAACAAGTVFEFPPLRTAPYSYDLSKVYYYAASNDKLSVTYGK